MFSGTFVNNETIVGWYICDGNNGTVNLVDKFVRGGITSGASGGSDDAVVVQHKHYFSSRAGPDLLTSALGGLVKIDVISSSTTLTGESGIGKNIPAYYTLIFIQRIS